MTTRVYTGPEGSFLEVGRRKPGRPPSDRTTRLQVKVSPAELREVHQRAEAQGLTASDLVRALLWPSGVTSAPDATST